MSDDKAAQDADQIEVDRIATLIYEHRWYGVPGRVLGRCNCHWYDESNWPVEITYVEHTRHVADVIVHADSGTGEGER